MSGGHEWFMALAIEEALAGLRAGERPFGSVVVREGVVVGRGRNVVRSSGDPTAHAEVMALRHAAAGLRTPDLGGATLYASCDPCPMCAGAMLYAGIATLVIGARSDALRRHGTPRRDLGQYRVERLAEMLGWRLEVVAGVLRDEAEAVFAEYQSRLAGSPPTP